MYNTITHRKIISKITNLRKTHSYKIIEKQIRKIKSKEMKQLEKIYLLNVLLYVQSNETIRKFRLINKKCLETTHMMRIYWKKTIKDYSKQTNIPKDIFTLYPTIETIICNIEDLIDINKRELFEKIHLIRLISINSHLGEASKSISLEIRNKVHQLYLWTNGTIINPFLLYPNITRFVISLNKLPTMKHSIFNCEGFLGNDTMIKFDYLMIKITYFDYSLMKELKLLKNYKRIEEKAVVVEEFPFQYHNKNKMIELEKEMNEIFDFVRFNTIRYIDCEEYYDKNVKQIDLRELQRMVNSYNVMNGCAHLFSIDLSSFHQLERLVTIPYFENSLEIKSIQSLKEIGYINDFSQKQLMLIPQSITKLIFYEKEMNYSIEQIQQLNPLINIKAIEIHQHIDDFNDNDNYIVKVLPNTSIQLEEIVIEVVFQKSDMYHMDEYNGNDLKILYNYHNIQKKFINFKCYGWQPSMKLISELQQLNITINIDIFVDIHNEIEILQHPQHQRRREKVEWISITQLPHHFKWFKCYNYFDSTLLNPNEIANELFNRIEEIELICEQPRIETDCNSYGYVDFHSFIKCKRFSCYNLFNTIDSVGVFILPSNIEEIDLMINDCYYGDFSMYSNLQIVTIGCYCSDESLSFMKIKLPSHVHYVKIHHLIEIVNRNEIIIDEIIIV